MDPITEMQHRVELVVTATIDTVEALASASKPDEARVP